ncbi:MAG: TIGR02391 family protein [Armatimonadota bacterium]
MKASEAKRILHVAKRIQMICPAPSKKHELEHKELFDQMVTEPELVECCRQLFIDGYYAHAVLEAFKCLNNFIKDKTKSDGDGSLLMQSVFDEKKPKLKINGLSNLSKQSQQAEQRGYMQIFAGCMAGIRNPRAHEHKLEDPPDVALEMTALANHLMRKAKMAGKP